MKLLVICVGLAGAVALEATASSTQWAPKKNAGVSAGPLHRWDRAQCGSNINGEQSCTSQGCLWGPLEHGSQDPWCYHKFTNKCAVNGDKRVDCGTPLHGAEGHRKWMCEQAGCCWQPTSHGQGRPWCFKAKATPKPCVVCAQAVPQCPKGCTKCEITAQTCDKCAQATCKSSTLCSHVTCKKERHTCSQHRGNHFGQRWTANGWVADAPLHLMEAQVSGSQPIHPEFKWAGVNAGTSCTGGTHDSIRVYHDNIEAKCIHHRCGVELDDVCRCHSTDDPQAFAVVNKPAVLRDVACADKRGSACSLFGSHSPQLRHAAVAASPTHGEYATAGEGAFSIHAQGYQDSAPSRNFLEYTYSRGVTVTAVRVEQHVNGCTQIAAWVDGVRVRDAVVDVPNFVEGEETVFVIPPPRRAGSVFRFSCIRSVDATAFALYRARPQILDANELQHKCVGAQGVGAGGCSLPFTSCAEGWFGETCKRSIATEKQLCSSSKGTFTCNKSRGSLRTECQCACPTDRKHRVPSTWTGSNGAECVPADNIKSIGCTTDALPVVSACSTFGSNSDELRTAVFGNAPQCPRYTCAPGYPQNRGIGEKAFSLHGMGYSQHTPKSGNSVTFHWYDPMTVSGVVVEQHVNGCTRVEGFMDGVSMGQANAQGAGVGTGQVGFFREGGEARFAFPRAMTGKSLKVQCVQSSHCCAFAIYRVLPTLA